MNRVNTVLGPVDPAQLGTTLIHEHLITDATRVRPDPDLTMDSTAAAVAELKDYAAAGGRTLVDSTTLDYGRNVFALRYIAERVPEVNLICLTGFNKGIFFAPWVHEISMEELADRLAAEILEGIQGSGIRAGLLKAGTYLDAITPAEEKTFRAIARAHRATGAAINTHTEAGTLALEQLRLLDREGVDLTRVFVGHLDRLLDFEYHRQVAATGATVSYDQIGKYKYYPDEARVEHILRLVDAGYERQIVLAGDYGRRSYLKAYGGGPGFAYLLHRFVPLLLAAGLTEQHIRTFLVENPRRLLTL